jgi:uncharacterized protein YodC (DUF2158 family)
MEKSKLQLGNLVKLNSGGPPMVIESIKNDVCSCKWADGNKIKTAEFRSCCLTLIPQPEEPQKQKQIGF